MKSVVVGGRVQRTFKEYPTSKKAESSRRGLLMGNEMSLADVSTVK